MSTDPLLPEPEVVCDPGRDGDGGVARQSSDAPSLLSLASESLFEGGAMPLRSSLAVQARGSVTPRLLNPGEEVASQRGSLSCSGAPFGGTSSPAIHPLSCTDTASPVAAGKDTSPQSEDVSPARAQTQRGEPQSPQQTKRQSSAAALQSPSANSTALPAAVRSPLAGNRVIPRPPAFRFDTKTAAQSSGGGVVMRERAVTSPSTVTKSHERRPVTSLRSHSLNDAVAAIPNIHLLPPVPAWCQPFALYEGSKRDRSRGTPDITCSSREPEELIHTDRFQSTASGPPQLHGTQRPQRDEHDDTAAFAMTYTGGLDYAVDRTIDALCQTSKEGAGRLRLRASRTCSVAPVKDTQRRLSAGHGATVTDCLVQTRRHTSAEAEGMSPPLKERPAPLSPLILKPYRPEDVPWARIESPVAANAAGQPPPLPLPRRRQPSEGSPPEAAARPLGFGRYYPVPTSPGAATIEHPDEVPVPSRDTGAPAAYPSRPTHRAWSAQPVSAASLSHTSPFERGRRSEWQHTQASSRRTSEGTQRPDDEEGYASTGAGSSWQSHATEASSGGLSLECHGGVTAGAAGHNSSNDVFRRGSHPQDASAAHPLVGPGPAFPGGLSWKAGSLSGTEWPAGTQATASLKRSSFLPSQSALRQSGISSLTFTLDPRFSSLPASASSSLFF